MSDLKTETELLEEYLKPTNLTLKELAERTALSQITQAMRAYHLQFERQANGVYMLLPAILDKIIEYIENTEQIIDGEWGSCRDLKELIRDKEMPELYDKLIALRDEM